MKALNWGIFKAALFFTIHIQTEIKVICCLPFFFFTQNENAWFNSIWENVYLIKWFPQWDRRTPGKKSALLFTPEMLTAGHLEKCYKRELSGALPCPGFPGHLVRPGTRMGPDSHRLPVTGPRLQHRLPLRTDTLWAVTATALSPIWKKNSAGWACRTAPAEAHMASPGITYLQPMVIKSGSSSYEAQRW